MTRTIRSIAVFVAVAATTAILTTTGGGVDAAREDPTVSLPATATFDGHEIKLVDGWGTADALPDVQACRIAETVECFRTERALLEHTFEGTGSRARCSSSLRLYDRTSFRTPVLYVSTRYSVVSLSPYGFSNRTESFRGGSCSATLYNGFGSGVYPGWSGGWAWSPTMASGWANVVSSVRLS